MWQQEIDITHQWTAGGMSSPLRRQKWHIWGVLKFNISDKRHYSVSVEFLLSNPHWDSLWAAGSPSVDRAGEPLRGDIRRVLSVRIHRKFPIQVLRANLENVFSQLVEYDTIINVVWNNLSNRLKGPRSHDGVRYWKMKMNETLEAWERQGRVIRPCEWYQRVRNVILTPI